MMQRHLLVIGLVLGGCVTAGAQGLTNFTDLYIGSGATLYVDNSIQNNTSSAIYNSGEVWVSGDLDNTGNPIVDAKVVLYGSNPQSITGSTTINDILEVNKTGGVATVVSGETRIKNILRLAEGEINGGNNLVIVSDLSGTGLVDDFSDPSYDGVQSGGLRVQRYVGEEPGYHYIGSAVNNASMGQLSELGLYGPDGGQVEPLPYCSPVLIEEESPFGNLFEWHEDGPWLVPGCQQSGWYVRSAGNLTNARGYAAIFNAGLLAFEVGGAPGNTSEFSTVSYGALSNTNTTGDGWHLVSNPFPSPMVWSAPPSGFDAQAHFFQATGDYSGTYQPILPNPGALISTMQGFFVRVSGGPTSFALPQTYRSLGNPPFYKADLTNSFDIEVEAGDFADKTTVRFGNEGETNGFDPMLDANKIKARGAQPTLKTRYRGVEYAINSLNLESHPMTVPMDLIPGVTGEFKFTAKHLDQFDVEAHVYLEDLKLEKIQELTINPVYLFNADESDDPERFLLHFRLGNEEPMFTGEEILMYAHDHNAFVFLPELEGRAELEVFNALGDLVYQTTDLYEGKNEVNLSNLATGAYILRATVNDQPITRKVIL